MTGTKLKHEPYALPFKNQHSNFWDKKNSTIDVDKYNKSLIEIVRKNEREREINEINRRQIEARQKEKNENYWRRKYESKYTSAYNPYTHDQMVESDKSSNNLRAMGFDE